jgi:hypothetical protein
MVPDRDAAFRIKVDRGSFQADMEWVSSLVQRTARQIAEMQDALRHGGSGTTGAGGGVVGRSGGGGSAGMSEAERALKLREKEEKRVQGIWKDLLKERDDAEKKSAKESAALAKIASKAESDKARAAKAAASEIAKVQSAAAKKQESDANAAARAASRAEDKKVRDAKRAADQIVKDQESAARKQEAISNQLARHEEANATRLQMRLSRIYNGVISSGARGAIRGAGQVFDRTVGRAAGGLLSGTGLDKAFDVGSVISERFQVQDEIQRAAIEAKLLGQKIDVDDTYRSARGVATKYGVSMSDVGGAMEAGRMMGQGYETSQSLDTIAKFSRVSGASMHDVSKMRASARQAGRTIGHEYSESDIDNLLATYTLAGQRGAFEMSDMARSSEMMFAGQIRGGLDPLLAAKSYMGVLQAAKTTSGSAKQTITAMMAAMAGPGGAQNAKHYAALGVETEGRDAISVAMEAVAAATDPSKRRVLGQIYTAQRGGKVTETMEMAANQASMTNREARMEAIMQFFANQASKSGGENPMAEINSQSDTLGQTKKAKFDQAIQQFHAAIEENAAPVIEKLTALLPDLIKDFGEIAPKIASIAESLMPLIKFAAEHPYLAAGGFIAKSAGEAALPAVLGGTMSYGVLKKALGASAAARLAGGAAAEGAVVAGGEAAAIGAGGAAVAGAAGAEGAAVTAAGAAALPWALIAGAAVAAVAAVWYLTPDDGLTEDFDGPGAGKDREGAKLTQDGRGHKIGESASFSQDMRLKYGDIDTDVSGAERDITDYGVGGGMDVPTADDMREWSSQTGTAADNSGFSGAAKKLDEYVLALTRAMEAIDGFSDSVREAKSSSSFIKYLPFGGGR